MQIPIDFHTGRSRGYAFVEMKNIASAKAAKEDLDGFNFQGRILHLGWGNRVI